MIQRINLIPEELRAKGFLVKVPVKYIVIIVLALLYIIPQDFSINNKTKDINAKITALEAKKLEVVANNIRLAALKLETDKIIEELATIKKASEALNSAIENRIFWSDILKEVSYLVPKKLWLSGVTSRNITVDVEREESKAAEKSKENDETVEKTVKQVTIKGSSYKNKTIKDFIKSLEESYFLDNVKLNYVKRRTINNKFVVYDFEVISELKK